MVLTLTAYDVNCIELASDNATSNVTKKLNMIFSSFYWVYKFKSQYKTSLSCLRIFVVHKYSVQLLLNFGDIFNNVNSRRAKKFVVSPEVFVCSHSGEAMSGGKKIHFLYIKHLTIGKFFFLIWNMALLFILHVKMVKFFIMQLEL